MLTIRMQRTGRKGLANYRIVVQDSRFSPSSGRVVSLLGHYNPHTKEIVLDKEKAKEYLANGAQPSTRVVKLFKDEKITLPSWVDEGNLKSSRNTKSPEKLRKNKPAEEAVEAQAETGADEVSAEEPVAEEPVAEEPVAEETKTETEETVKTAE